MKAKLDNPDFLIIGAAKCATTTLSNLLNAHPQACMVQGKEPHFFSTDNYYAGWERYQTLYRHCGDCLATGDASTSYSRIRYHPETITRIVDHIPSAKIIYMVRHPLKRMESACLEHLATPGNPLRFKSVDEALKKQPMIIDSSRYWEVYDRYRRSFPEDNIRIIWFEEFIKDPHQVFSEICDFLGIDKDIKVNIEGINKNSRQDAIRRIKSLGNQNAINLSWSAETKSWVLDLIREDNLTFLKYFDKPSDYWGELY